MVVLRDWEEQELQFDDAFEQATYHETASLNGWTLVDSYVKNEKLVVVYRKQIK